ncbi:MAG TPA: hypothetical protein VHZ97_27055 [Pseudonocardiaceae bacterium]|nr:hypothetical protein [Pseudonocardiaceae bacterium]
MVNRRTKLALAAIASIGGLVAGGKLYLHYMLEREDHLGVTLYSEPNYRGRSRTLTRAGNPDRFCSLPGGFCSLRDMGLPRVGSIRVQRFTDGFRPALIEAPAAWAWARGALFSVISRDFEEARDSAYNAANLSLGVLKPSFWRFEANPAGDRASWVRLWASKPTYPLPPCDEAIEADEEPWRDVLTDIPDLGAWRERTRYLEFGVRNA